MQKGRPFVKQLASALILGSSVLGFSAHAVTVNFDTGTNYSTDALTGYSTYGDDMAGISVTAVFLNGTTETLSWQATGAGSGGVMGAGWGLRQSGDTFGPAGAWSLMSDVGLSGLIISGSPGDTIFDVAVDSNGNVLPGDGGLISGTEGSARGWTFELTIANSAVADMLNVTYSNIVSLTGNDPVGDLWETLSLDFGGNGFMGRLGFIADTDTAAANGVSVPAPISLALLGIGLIGMGLARKKQY